jgi:hypothetical protein
MSDSGAMPHKRFYEKVIKVKGRRGGPPLISVVFVWQRPFHHSSDF